MMSTIGNSVGAVMLLTFHFLGCVHGEAPETLFDEVAPEQDLVQTLDREDAQYEALGSVRELGSYLFSNAFKQTLKNVGKNAKQAKIVPSPVVKHESVKEQEAAIKAKGEKVSEIVPLPPAKPVKCKQSDTLCNNLMATKAFLFAGSFNGEFTESQLGVIKDLVKALQPTEEPIMKGKHDDGTPAAAQEEFQAWGKHVDSICAPPAQNVERMFREMHGLYCKMAKQTRHSLMSGDGLLNISPKSKKVCLNDKACGLTEAAGMGAMCVHLSEFQHLVRKIKAGLVPMPKMTVVSNKELPLWWHILSGWKGNMW